MTEVDPEAPAADQETMNVNDLVLVQGMKDTRGALRAWNQRPAKLLAPWFALSFAIAVALLGSIYAVAKLSTPDLTPLGLPGFNRAARPDDYIHLLTRNSLVLALHALACVAGFIAGSSLPLSAANRSGVDRWIHEKAGPLAIGFVGCATTFSLATQAYIIGSTASTVALQIGTTPGMLLVALAPHVFIELVALFLPLAAWLIASRRGRWDELLAATAVTVAIAVPMLLASAAIELWISPHVMAEIATPGPRW